MRKSFITAALAAISIIPSVQASTASGTLTVEATVAASCVVNTSSTGTQTDAVLDFGTVSSFASNVDANTSSSGGAQVGVLCNNGTDWTLAMDAGENESGTQRQMTGGSSEYIPYDLYSDSAYTTAIGINTTALSGTGTGSEQTYDIYGRIPAGSTLPSVGSYSDTVTMTVTY